MLGVGGHRHLLHRGLPCTRAVVEQARRGEVRGLATWGRQTQPTAQGRAVRDAPFSAFAASAAACLALFGASGPCPAFCGKKNLKSMRWGQGRPQGCCAAAASRTVASGDDLGREVRRVADRVRDDAHEPLRALRVRLPLRRRRRCALVRSSATRFGQLRAGGRAREGQEEANCEVMHRERSVPLVD